MSAQLSPEHVCYVHCNFCNTILAVSVPGSNMFNIVTVRCGHCANLLSVNMRVLQTHSPQELQGGKCCLEMGDIDKALQNYNIGTEDNNRAEHGSSSKCNRRVMMYSRETDQQQMLPIHPPEKRQRVPSAYNRFIKEEIQRIKTNNPEISHREAFSAAAKNWAHFPHIHFGLSNHDSNKQVKLDEAIAAQSSKKSQVSYQ